MPERDDDLVSRYATKVVETLERQRDVADEALLRTIAVELGMTDEQLAAAVGEAEVLLTQAASLRQHGAVDEAVIALERAWALAPMRADVRCALADALFARWRKSKRTDDLAQARQFARATIELQPTNSDALSLLQRIANEEKLAERSSPKGALIAWVVAGVAIAAAVASTLVRC